MKLTIPKHILQQLQTRNARAPKSAIKFRAEDYRNTTEIEYAIIRFLLHELGIRRYRFISQTIMVNRFYKVFDSIEVKVNHDNVLKFWFDISETFGRYDPHNHLTRKLYLGF